MDKAQTLDWARSYGGIARARAPIPLWLSQLTRRSPILCADSLSPTSCPGEAIAGEYVWGRYDLLLLPPSFPYGGMENPCLTFVTPTLLAGDRWGRRVCGWEKCVLRRSRGVRATTLLWGLGLWNGNAARRVVRRLNLFGLAP